MNKYLEALKEGRHFRHEKEKHLVVIDIDYFNKCLDGIETELKRKQDLEQMLHKMNVKHGYKEYLEISKALEIIKEKGIDILEFKATRKAKTYNENTKGTYVKDYTDEEYDLLKKVLL